MSPPLFSESGKKKKQAASLTTSLKFPSSPARFVVLGVFSS